MIQPIRAKKIEPPKTIWVHPLFAALSTRQEQNNDRYISVDHLEKWITQNRHAEELNNGEIKIVIDCDELYKFIGS